MTLYQVNSDLGFVQGGSESVSYAGMILGAKSGTPTFHTWEDVRWSLLSNSPSYVTRFDDFTGAALSTAWATNLATGATISINAQSGGVIRFLTDTDDNDHATLALGLNWTVSNGYTFFTARVKNVSASTLRAVEIGLSDALSEAGGLAYSSHVVGAPTTVATNAVMFGYDTDGSMTSWAALNTNADVDASVDTGVAVDTSWHVFTIIVDALGNAYYYIDGVLTNTVELAVATTAVLTPYISLISLSAAAKTLDVDYVGVAGTRA